MTASELQALLHRGGRVDLTHGLSLSAPLELPAGTWLDLHGHLLAAAYTDPVTGRRGPAIVTGFTRGYPQLTGVERGSLTGGVQFRSLPVGDKIHEAALFRLSDLRITTDGIAIDDVYTGAWMGTVERIWVNGPKVAGDCQAGIRHYGGTTWTLTACHVSGAEIAYDFETAYSTTLIGCAADRSTLHMLRANQCRGLSLINFHGEGNVSKSGPIIAIRNTEALTINSAWTVGNRLRPGKGQASYLLELGNVRGVINGLSLGGGTRPTPDYVDGDEGGHTVTVIIHARCNLVFSGCHLASAKVADGCKTKPNFAVMQIGEPSVVIHHGCTIEEDTHGRQ